MLPTEQYLSRPRALVQQPPVFPGEKLKIPNQRANRPHALVRRLRETQRSAVIGDRIERHALGRAIELVQPGRLKQFLGTVAEHVEARPDGRTDLFSATSDCPAARTRDQPRTTFAMVWKGDLSG